MIRKEEQNHNFYHRNASFKKIRDIFIENDTLCSGISNSTRKKKLFQYGPNLVEEDNFRWLTEFSKIIWNPFIIILLTISGWYFSQFFVKKSNDIGDLFSFILIVCTIGLSIFLNLSQNFSFYRVSKSLKKMVDVQVNCYFNDCPTPCLDKKCLDKIQNINYVRKRVRKINCEWLVIGDIIFLAAGDIVPADVRIVTAENLFVDESTLTGEDSLSVKCSRLEKTNSRQFLKLSNICFSGTSVVAGKGVGIVIATANRTFFGKIVAASRFNKKITNSFEQGVRKVSWVMMKLILFLVPIIFLFSFIKNHSFSYSFTYAIAVVIGLTPEILPMIISVSLIHSSKELAKKKTIVRNLPAVQNLGEMNILCCDKTGTLTKNGLTVIKILNILGSEIGGGNVLKFAYLNSYFQSGMKNSIDQAIISSSINKKNELVRGYQKIEEIPFDSTRKRLSVIVREENKNQFLVCKGSVKKILEQSTFYQKKTGVFPFNEKMRKRVLAIEKKYSSVGFKLIGVAMREKVKAKNEGQLLENGLTFIGFIVFSNELKSGIKNVINSLLKKEIKIKIMTGDNSYVAANICSRLGIKSNGTLTGLQIDELDDQELLDVVIKVNIFSELNPIQKSRIIKILKSNQNVVGFIGDGINDVLALNQADVGISVQNATDIAKKHADVIILEHDLNILNKAVVGGRRSFVNILKYVKITMASQLGDVMSLLIASVWLPVIPILPVQILFKNLLYDISQLWISWDRVDKEQIASPVTWKEGRMINFSFWNGLISPFFDVIVFAVVGFGIWNFARNKESYASFYTSWFVFCTIMQTLAIHVMRTTKIPFFRSFSSWQIIFSTLVICVLVVFLPFTVIGRSLLSLHPLPFMLLMFLIALNLIYCVVMQFVKLIYMKVYGEWL